MNEVRVRVVREVPAPEHLDLFVCAVGFEQRSTHVGRTLAGRFEKGMGFAFTERRVLNFKSNLEWCTNNGVQVFDFSAALDGERLLRDSLAEAQKEPRTPTVLVDVSSMSRPMIASVVFWLARIAGSGSGLQATFAYCPSKHVDLGQQMYTTAAAGPVTSGYAGWNDPHKRLVAVVGLGGERGLALGAVEHLQATDVWAFFPTGVDNAYDGALEQANQELLERIGTRRVIKFSPLDPFSCFCELESLTYGCLQQDRPILVPFGPKMLAVAMLLVAESFRPLVPVWRISSDQEGEPIDREARGPISLLTARFDLVPQRAVRNVVGIG